MAGRIATLVAFASTAFCFSLSHALASEEPGLHLDRQSNCSLYDIESRAALSARWSGRCARGLASGRGTATFERDDRTQLTITAAFANGRIEDGEASVQWSAGAHFEGHWAHGAPNGHGSIMWANGDRYEGDFTDGRAEGQGLEIWANGDRYEGPWHNDVPDGLGIFTKMGGAAQRITFVAGKPQPRLRQTAPDSIAPQPVTSSPPDRSFFSDLSGKTLTGLDGSSIRLEVVDGGVVRTIVNPGGQSERIVFKILNGNLGTISKVDGSQQVTGFFRTAASGLDAQYADGRLEHFALNGAGGLTSLIVSPSGEEVCLSWFPDGHRFSKDERKAAIVAYARRLGVAMPASAAAARRQCVARSPGDTAGGRADPSPIRPTPKPIAEHASLPPYKLGEGPANLQVVAVHDSVVHPIDAPLTAIAEANTTAPVTDEVFASKCLRVDSDGSYWGFRNHCGYSVQFAYCLLHNNDDTPSCGSDGTGAATGSVSASGFSTLFADTSLSGGRTEHDFRWVACRGGAGEVVPRLDTPEPATGRCLKPATDHRQQAAN